MKRIISISVLTLGIICLLSLVYAQAQEPYRYVKVEGRQLLVDFDKDGVYKSYLIKGVAYSPFLIGRHPSDWGDNIFDDEQILNRDFVLLQAMGCNTIRIWKGDDTEDGSGGCDPGQCKSKITQTTLDLAEAYGIKVVAGFWIDTKSPGPCIQSGPNAGWVYHTPDFTDQDVRADILDRFETYVHNFKDHPAILFWAIGNENNMHIDRTNTEQIKAFYSLVNEMAERAHTVEGVNYHPVAFVSSDGEAAGFLHIGDAAKGAADSQLSYLDIWGINVFRGNSFGTLFSDLASKTQKPIWISEYGIDAFNGTEDQTTQAQWIGDLWDEIVANNITIGGTVMEYSDEWWKPNEWIGGGIYNDTQETFYTGCVDIDCPNDGIDWCPPAPDARFNHEWWGIMAIAPDGDDEDTVDDILPRKAYDTLRDKFEDGGPDTCADLDKDALGEVDIGDVTYLISYLFLGGPAPEPLWVANVDGSEDGVVDIGDLTYLIDYLFLGGPPPNCTGEGLLSENPTKGWTIDDVYYYMQTGQEPNNSSPVLNPIANKSVYARSTLSFQISGQDADGDPLTYSISGLPSGASFNASTRTFTWRPTYSQAGYHYVTFMVTDTHGASDSERIQIYVKRKVIRRKLKTIR